MTASGRDGLIGEIHNAHGTKFGETICSLDTSINEGSIGRGISKSIISDTCALMS